jgi:acetyl esterase/lipase
MNTIIKTAIGLTAIFLLSAAPAGDPKEFLLWPNGAPGSEGKTGKEKVRIAETGDHVISGIHHPSITPYLPAPGKETGAAIVIAPGGGHRELWIDHEGYNVAKWLCEHGIAEFVLKYRLAKEDSSTYSVDQESLDDIHRAIRMVRSRASEWKVDTGRIGVMGFSAGGELAGLSAMRYDNGNLQANDMIDRNGCKPAFQVLIYPGSSGRFEVTKNSPPAFIACGYKDRDDISAGMADLYLKFKKAGVPAELHVYAGAGHGFGLRATNQGATSDWLPQLNLWMGDMGLLKR